MAGWLSRTTSLFKQPSATPEPFEVECDCGGKIVGQRSPMYQKPTCPVCDRPVFVLPANVYPRPKPKSVAKSPPTLQSSPNKSGRRPSAAVIDQGPPPIPVKSAANGTKPVAGHHPSSPVEIEPSLLRNPRSPILTPLRVITVAMIGISALTASFLWHRNAIATAQATVSVAADAAKAAVRENDFVLGAREYERARLAVDLLGRKDQTADEIRRLSKETTALANLASSSLIEILQETLSNAKPGQTESPRISSLDKNAWVIFDTRLVPSEGKDRFLVDAPIILGKISIQIEIESAILSLVPQNGDEPPRIIFAAQIEEISALHGEPPTSRLTLNGKSAILWTSYDTYCAVGFRPFDSEYEHQTKALLERQLEIR
jgi:hypothetical protein